MSFPLPPRVSLERARQFLQLCRALGLPLDDALARAGLALAPLPEAPGFVGGALFERVLATGLRLVDDPLPGLALAQRQGGGAFTRADFLLQDARTVGALFATLIRIEPLAGDLGRTRLRQHGDELRLRWDSGLQDAFVRDQVADFLLATWAGLVFAAARPGLRVIEAVHFRHDGPPALPLLHRYLDTFACSVYFGQPDDSLLLAPHALDLLLPGADPGLAGLLERAARKPAPPRRPQPRLLDQARTLLHQLLVEGQASRERLAARMGIHPRTLHNKLVEAGTSYRELLDDLRLVIARNFLRDSPLAIHEVAERVGFDGGGTFARWFRQMTGASPSEYRAVEPPHPP